MSVPVFARDISVTTLARSWGASLLDAILPRRKTLARLRARWGAEGDKHEYLASRYFDLIRDASPGDWVDDKTWGDLEFPEILAHMDTTVTPIGSQVLFALLRRYTETPDAQGQRYATYAELASNASLRESIQLRLARLEDDANAGLAELLFGERVDKPARRILMLSWSLVTFMLLVLVAVTGWSAWLWLPVLPINAVILFRAATRQHREIEAMKRCIGLLDVADKLASLHAKHPAQAQLAGLHAQASQRTVVRQGLFWLSVMRWASNPELLFLPMLLGVLNFVFLVELVIHAGTIERFFRIRGKLRATFRLVGEIDAAIAVASCLHRWSCHCLPKFSDEPILAVTDGRHPLLADGVPNSIRLERRSVLVTGSNMAGKTTFIKMLATNAILAQTAGFCLASAAIIPRSTVMASIHGGHSIASGKSHYFAEIEAIDGFIRNGAPGRMRVIAVDEPFSGTNTVERIAVARAVLEALASQAIVLVTTHDVELQALLGERYVLCHFQENPAADGYFDYTLKTGAATERNAIRLLDRLGFPKAITANAMRYARQDLSAERPSESPIRNALNPGNV